MVMVMSCCVMIFRGHTMIFNNLIPDPPCAMLCLSPWGRTQAMGDAFVSAHSRACTVPGTTGREGAVSEQWALPLGANSNSDGRHQRPSLARLLCILGKMR